jgi:hypothetical protein
MNNKVIHLKNITICLKIFERMTMGEMYTTGTRHSLEAKEQKAKTLINEPDLPVQHRRANTKHQRDGITRHSRPNAVD